MRTSSFFVLFSVITLRNYLSHKLCISDLQDSKTVNLLLLTGPIECCTSWTGYTAILLRSISLDGLVSHAGVSYMSPLFTLMFNNVPSFLLSLCLRACSDSSICRLLLLLLYQVICNCPWISYAVLSIICKSKLTQKIVLYFRSWKNNAKLKLPAWDKRDRVVHNLCSSLMAHYTSSAPYHHLWTDWSFLFRWI